MILGASEYFGYALNDSGLSLMMGNGAPLISGTLVTRHDAISVICNEKPLVTLVTHHIRKALCLIGENLSINTAIQRLSKPGG